MDNKEKKQAPITDLIKKLEFLFTNANSISYLKQSKDFQEIIKNELYVLSHWDDKIKMDEKLATELVKKYNKTVANHVSSSYNDKHKNYDIQIKKIIEKYNELVTNNKYEEKATTTFNDENDYLDYAKYLDTYCKNILKVNLDKIDDSSQIQFVEPKAETIATKPNATNAAFIGGMNIDPTSPSITIPNPALQQQAQQNLQKKMLNNEIYLFTSKPKHIPIFKIIFAVGVSIFSIFLIISSIFMIIINGKNSGFYNNDGNEVTYSTLWTAVFGILFALLFIWMLTSPIFRAIKIHRQNKSKISDMEKYGVNVFNLIITIVFGIFYGLFMVWPTMGMGTVFEYYSHLIAKHPGVSYVNAVMGLAVSTGILLGGCAIMVISGIVLGATKPKEDRARYQQLLVEEFNKIVASNGSNPPTENPVDLSDKEVKN